MPATSLPSFDTYNRLLTALPRPEHDRLAPDLQLVSMRLGEMLYQPGEPQRYAYFPTTAVVSLHYTMASGASAVTAGVGNEGVIGVSLFMGGETAPNSAVVQIAGQAYSLEAATLKREFKRGDTLQRLLLQYTQALITQTTQTAACNRHHTVRQQLCRWLLFTLDRVSSDELVVTQELIAGVLGVRRESVTEAAGALQRDGVIRNRRGHIAVLDRSRLKASACECYGVVTAESRRLLLTAR